MRQLNAQKAERAVLIRRAGAGDLDGIMELMQQVKAGMEHPEWYVIDERAWVERHLKDEGFIIVAEGEGGAVAGFFIVDTEPEDNLGAELFSEPEKLRLVAHMDSAAVAPDYRGQHLQGRMLDAAEQELNCRKEQYLFCTVHPDNYASLHTMQSRGYQIIATKEKYGGLKRHVLYKKKMQSPRRPRVLVSACLLGVNCRYNGKGELNPNVSALMEEAELIPVCPEILGGLATPRDPAERVGAAVITKTGIDVTAQYRRGAEETLKLAKLYGCTCAILKERSPSCGSGSIYDGTYTRTLIPGDGTGAELLKANGIAVFGESRSAECRAFLRKPEQGALEADKNQ